MNRWTYYILLIAIVIVGGVYLYRHRQELGLASSPGSGADSDSGSNAVISAPQPTPMAWQHIDRTQVGFTVDMPSEIREIQIPAYTERGASEQVNMIVCNPDAVTSYSVAWADNPPVARANGDSPDRTLDTARDEALAHTQTTLLSESTNSIQGFPTRDFAARNAGGGILDSRLIYTGPRLYMLTAAFPSAAARRETDVTRFFNSFHVVSASSIPETLPPASLGTN